MKPKFSPSTAFEYVSSGLVLARFVLDRAEEYSSYLDDRTGELREELLALGRRQREGELGSLVELIAVVGRMQEILRRLGELEDTLKDVLRSFKDAEGRLKAIPQA